jgi:hypothetical protein
VIPRPSSLVDLALHEPGHRRRVRVPRPDRLVAVAIEARPDRQRTRPGLVPWRLLRHRRVRAPPIVRGGEPQLERSRLLYWSMYMHVHGGHGGHQDDNDRP